jgi:hypothetical protein
MKLHCDTGLRPVPAIVEQQAAWIADHHIVGTGWKPVSQ